MAIKALKSHESIDVISPYLPAKRAQQIKKSTASEVTSLSERSALLSLIYRAVEGNEAMLWGVAWLMESLFRANSSLLRRKREGKSHKLVVNLSYTVPARCSILWNQATPPLETLRVMGQTNIVAKILFLLAGGFVSLLDRNVRRRHKVLSSMLANNSSYHRNLYASQGWKSDAVINVQKEFTEPDSHEGSRTKDFVLSYIGKETEVDTLIDLAKRGVKIVSFGSKIPFGTSLAMVRVFIDFRGFVSE